MSIESTSDPIRSSLVALATDTLSIIERGAYDVGGKSVCIRDSVDAALRGTTLHSPPDLEALRARPRRRGPPGELEVTGETTIAAARRLHAQRPGASVVSLNFASARSVGGGFLGGARAQEESLCRASALYPTLVLAPRYYDENRASLGTMYTDWAIHSPGVPVFRDDAHDLLSEPFTTSFITMPAPNLRSMKDPDPAEIEATFERRIAMVLALAVDRGHDTLVLGAWGCGAFRNEPALVAAAFRRALFDEGWGASFAHVTFAVFDGRRESNLATFARAFESPR